MSDKTRSILIRLLTFGVGLGLLAAVLLSADLEQVAQYLTQVGVGFVLMGPLIFGKSAMTPAPKEQSS